MSRAKKKPEEITERVVLKKVDVEYSEESGCYHIFLTFPNGDRVEVAQHCDEMQTEDAARDINRFAQS